MTFVSKRLRWHLVLLRNSFITLHRITTITVATPDFEEALKRATAEHCGFPSFKCQAKLMEKEQLLCVVGGRVLAQWYRM
jgi:hypothetical protein